MKNFNFGIKLRSNESCLLEDAERLLDGRIFSYVEVLLNPNFLEEKPFLEHKIPYVIHAPQENFEVNIGDNSNREYTFRMIKESIRWANALDAKFIILHAGTGSCENARAALSEIDDSRVILENMPVKGIYGDKCLGYNAESISELIRIGEFGLCLDFGHAVKAAFSLNADYKKLISNLMNLNPRLYHISDGDLSTEVDNHLDIGKGEFDFDYFKYCISKGDSNLITLETPRHDKSLEENLRNISILKMVFDH